MDVHMKHTDDLSDPKIIENPHKYFGHLRDTNPVYMNERWGGWIITQYDDVEACLQDNDRLSVERKTDRLTQGNNEVEETGNMISRWMIFRDPPEHTRLRSLTLEAFNTAAIEELRPDAERITQSLIDNIKQRGDGEIDFIDDFAYALPVKIISAMLGVPEEDSDKIKEWSRGISYTLLHMYDEENRHQKTERAVKEITSYLRDLIQKREKNPQDDLISYLIQAQSEGNMLDQDEVVATALLMLFGGHETTMNLLANGVNELLKHPDQMAQLRDDPSLIDGAVEEMLRYEGPIKGLIRTATEDFEFRGNQIEEGHRLLLTLASANRDPAVFDNPDEFDITRGPSDHIAFGGGIHYCIGAPLARLEAQVAIPAFLNAFSEIERATDEESWRRSATVRAQEELPLRVSY